MTPTNDRRDVVAHAEALVERIRNYAEGRDTSETENFTENVAETMAALCAELALSRDRLQFLQETMPLVHANRAPGIPGLVLLDIDDRRYARPTLVAAIDDAIRAGEWVYRDAVPAFRTIQYPVAEHRSTEHPPSEATNG